MATFLDIGLVKSFEPIFSFLFVFVVSYAILNKVDFPKGNKGLQAAIAFLFGIFMALSPKVSELVSTMSPWFILLFIFTLFVLMGIMMFGVEEKWITDSVKKDDTIIVWIIIISVLIVLVSFSQVYSAEFLAFTQNATSSGTQDVGHNVGAALFHPKMLGLVFILLVGVFAIMLLAKTPKIS